MREFDACLETRRKIIVVQEQITEIEARLYSPRNQVITDMPKGRGGNANGNDALLIKAERLRDRRAALYDNLVSQWRTCDGLLTIIDAKSNEIELMKLRFYYGLSWDKCSKEMNWNINKCFRTYRKLVAKLCKIHKNEP